MEGSLGRCRRAAEIPVDRSLLPTVLAVLCVILSTSLFTLLSLLPPQEFFSAIFPATVRELGPWKRKGRSSEDRFRVAICESQVSLIAFYVPLPAVERQIHF